VDDDADDLRLHPLLRSRWSPLVFDTGDEASPEDVRTLLEAARWAPSASNSQPRAFIVARRGDSLHRRLVAHLARSSAA
jgi:nitroreductase